MDWKEETKVKFGERLLALLEQHEQRTGEKLSLRQLANRADLEYSQVQRITKGQVDLALTTIIALGQGLDIPAKELLDY